MMNQKRVYLYKESVEKTSRIGTGQRNRVAGKPENNRGRLWVEASDRKKQMLKFECPLIGNGDSCYHQNEVGIDPRSIQIRVELRFIVPFQNIRKNLNTSFECPFNRER